MVPHPSSLRPESCSSATRPDLHELYVSGHAKIRTCSYRLRIEELSFFVEYLTEAEDIFGARCLYLLDHEGYSTASPEKLHVAQ